MSARGFALPLVLWCVAFLAGVALLLVGLVDRWADDQVLAERRFAARQHALSGIALGMSPDIEPGDPILVTGYATRNGHAVRITDESARINPNFWLAAGDREVFEKLFTSWGADSMTINQAIDGMSDWIDPDDFVLLNGAERGQYEALGLVGFPPNEPFTSEDELAAVIGLRDLLADHEGWKDLFTVWHRGKINVRFASAPVLAAVAGLTPEQAESLIVLRSGKDRIDGTEDDQEFGGMEDVTAVVNANAAQAASLEKFFTLEGGTRRVESTGWAEGASYQIVAIVQGQSGNAILSWKER